jgi:hypothetical protein
MMGICLSVHEEEGPCLHGKQQVVKVPPMIASGRTGRLVHGLQREWKSLSERDGRVEEHCL